MASLLGVLALESSVNPKVSTRAEGAGTPVGVGALYFMNIIMLKSAIIYL